MLPPFYQACLSAQLSQIQLITLTMLVALLQRERHVSLKRLATLFAQPIQFESRRRNLQRFLVLGFGQSSRPALNYKSALYQQLLHDFVAATFNTPVAVVAAEPASGYMMQVAQQKPCPWSKIVLVAPTWKGPLRVMGAPTPIRDAVKELVRSPLLGQFLYKLNTTPAFLNWMYRRHVYTDATTLTPDFIDRKHQITQQPGARFAPAAFVTGTLDPAANRDEFLAWFQALSIPIMIVIGEQAPPSSKAEMEAMAELPGVQVKRLPGTLGLHEEFATEVAAAISPFLLA